MPMLPCCYMIYAMLDAITLLRLRLIFCRQLRLRYAAGCLRYAYACHAIRRIADMKALSFSAASCRFDIIDERVLIIYILYVMLRHI